MTWKMSENKWLCLEQVKAYVLTWIDDTERPNVKVASEASSRTRQRVPHKRRRPRCSRITRGSARLAAPALLPASRFQPAKRQAGSLGYGTASELVPREEPALAAYQAFPWAGSLLSPDGEPELFQKSFTEGLRAMLVNTKEDFHIVKARPSEMQRVLKMQPDPSCSSFGLSLEIQWNQGMPATHPSSRSYLLQDTNYFGP
nr:PREDICTED: uncharacterized protein LOC106489830 [Apteryx mantelli mantelli]